MAELETEDMGSFSQDAKIPTERADWTEGQFEALVTLHMLKPGHVLTADECWAIEYTRQQADEVENSAIDAFDEGRKFGIVSVAGKTDAAMFEELERLRIELATEKALRRYYAGIARGDDTVECDACCGSGKIVEDARTVGINQHSACQMVCEECDGSGRVAAEPDAAQAGTQSQSDGVNP